MARRRKVRYFNGKYHNRNTDWGTLLIMFVSMIIFSVFFFGFSFADGPDGDSHGIIIFRFIVPGVLMFCALLFGIPCLYEYVKEKKSI